MLLYIATNAPFLADYIIALIEGFDSMLASAGNPLVLQLGGHLCGQRAGQIRLRT